MHNKHTPQYLNSPFKYYSHLNYFVHWLLMTTSYLLNQRHSLACYKISLKLVHQPGLPFPLQLLKKPDSTEDNLKMENKKNGKQDSRHENYSYNGLELAGQ